VLFVFSLDDIVVVKLLRWRRHGVSLQMPNGDAHAPPFSR
jgi:hypothetical protein